MDTGFLLGKVKKLWRRVVVVMAAEQCEHAKSQTTVHFQLG